MNSSIDYTLGQVIPAPHPRGNHVVVQNPRPWDTGPYKSLGYARGGMVTAGIDPCINTTLDVPLTPEKMSTETEPSIRKVCGCHLEATICSF